jgi:type I restriction enzyme, S subunit
MTKLTLTKKYGAYPQYKDSSVDWIGKIPKEWGVTKFKGVYSVSNERVRDYKNVTQLLSVSGYRGIEKKDVSSMDGQMPSEDIGAYRIVRPGQLVVNTMWLNYTGLGVSKFTGYVSPAYRSYNVSEKMDPSFVHYLMRSIPYVQKYSSLLYGIRPNSLQVKPNDFESIEIFVPKKNEQKKIADFLDDKTATIDNIIEKKKQQTELLKEKRAAVINHAVTKGLDPKAKLVDSGFQWLGNIPTNWNVDKVAHHTLVNSGGVWGEEDLLEDGVTVLRSTEITQNGEWNLADPITRKLSASEYKKAKLFEYDLLITKSSGSADHLGKTAIVTKEIEMMGCAYSNFMQRIKLDNSFLPRFFFYLINNSIGRDQINYWGSTTSGLVNLNASLIGRFVFPIPPIEEQKEIVAYLDKKISIFDTAISNVERSIDLINEFKSSLISHAVTGKIKI